MCLAIPGLLEEIIQGDSPMGMINYGGVIKSADLSFVPEVKIGDYVVVHAGFAITVLNEKEAKQSIAEFSQLQSVIDNDNSGDNL